MIHYNGYYSAQTIPSPALQTKVTKGLLKQATAILESYNSAFSLDSSNELQSTQRELNPTGYLTYVQLSINEKQKNDENVTSDVPSCNLSTLLEETKTLVSNTLYPGSSPKPAQEKQSFWKRGLSCFGKVLKNLLVVSFQKVFSAFHKTPSMSDPSNVTPSVPDGKLGGYAQLNQFIKQGGSIQPLDE